MLTTRNKGQLTQLANDMAAGFDIVLYNHVLYLPVHFDSLEPIDPMTPQEERVWVQLSMPHLLRMANDTSKVMFYGEGEKAAFYGMVEQAAKRETAEPGYVLMIKDGKLVELRPDGKLHDRSPGFCPHVVTTPVNDDAKAKAEVLATIVEWLGGSEEDAESLLFHLATALATNWSAVKYVLLIGEGRNGKSLLLKMLIALLGEHSVSYVTRQDMAASKSTALDLQGRLANVVFDGSASYLKDSGPEKSLIAGETTPIRRLYSSLVTPVRTNGLFIEGLNREPKTGDKSSALQKRLVRFQFPNVYELDYVFEQRMLSEELLGAFLSLLLDHYVQHHEAHTKLRPTTASTLLQLEQEHSNSLQFQFIHWFDEDDMVGAQSLIGMALPDVAEKFKTWRLTEANDISSWGSRDVEQMLLPLFTTERKSKRSGGKVRKVRIITGFKQDLVQFIDYLHGEEATDADTSDSGNTVVAEGSLREVGPASGN